MNPPCVLLGDIGGTNTRLALLVSNAAGLVGIARFRNADYATFDDLLRAYLAQQNKTVCDAVVLAVAAPVDGDIVQLTNCPWQIVASSIRKTVGAQSLQIINDLEALAHALDHLPSPAVTPIAGPMRPTDAAGRKLVLGVGTGFNAACVIRSAVTVVLPAECGHMTMPVETADGLHLRDYLARGRGRASVERALSGQGLIEVYQWVAERAGHTPQDLTAAQIAACAVVANDAHCVAASQIVLNILAIVAGDLVLAYLPHGGVYLAGSVARALAPMIATSGFESRFTQKGRQSGLLGSFPISLITDDGAGLIGCAALAQTQSTQNMEHAE